MFSRIFSKMVEGSMCIGLRASCRVCARPVAKMFSLKSIQMVQGSVCIGLRAVVSERLPPIPQVIPSNASAVLSTIARQGLTRSFEQISTRPPTSSTSCRTACIQDPLFEHLSRSASRCCAMARSDIRGKRSQRRYVRQTFYRKIKHMSGTMQCALVCRRLAALVLAKMTLGEQRRKAVELRLAPTSA
jgi:hypothetical protein